MFMVHLGSNCFQSKPEVNSLFGNTANVGANVADQVSFFCMLDERQDVTNI